MGKVDPFRKPKRRSPLRSLKLWTVTAILAGGALGAATLVSEGSLSGALIGPAELSRTADHGRAIDGDTLRLGATTVRLLNIDAPEAAQTCGSRACGRDATLALAALLASGPVTCDGTRHDRYGRLLAHCAVDGQDLGAQLVASGDAVAFVRYSREYLPQERTARAAKRGIWSQANPQMPWDYRRLSSGGQPAQALPVSDTTPGDCRIKGNIARDGERIYHLPGQRYYGETQISRLKGERWFCSEDEARRAGWRKARV
ncbi:thermonuclease family protein [Pseudooceanicola sp. 216_PA32_1]|uniref:Thermonuclease family protein n=1 Tax=Pseudooceanicola pacificus TaxID=2676438 RepID=A0A844W3P7_9RHOB|nr:thermonuclease family protein [Pseudooceanicola pacificus]MWB78826.1 thermonuclease family protein [Pseudooceanicola pacificus]